MFPEMTQSGFKQCKIVNINLSIFYSQIWNHPDILYKLLQEKKAQEDIDLDIDITLAANSGVSSANCGIKKRCM